MSYKSIRLLHSSSRLLNYSNLKMTLFSKDNCGLCDKAKGVMNQVLENNQDIKAKAVYKIVNIDEPSNKEWWEKYCFDIPVLHLEDTTKEGSLIKIFHRLEEADVEEKIDTFK